MEEKPKLKEIIADLPIVKFFRSLFFKTNNERGLNETMETKYIARCMKCKKDVQVKNPEIVDMKGKGNSIRKAIKGICPECSTKVFRIVKKNNGN